MARRIALTAILLAAGCTSSEAPPPQPATTAPPPTPPATGAPTTSTTTSRPPAPTTTTGPLPVVVGRPAATLAPPLAGADSVPPAAASVSGAGKASWYARGSTTASGERFDADGLSAAHRTLAFGTRLRVCRPVGEPCVVVVVNDRGPNARTGRELDLSRGAFAAIAPLGAGVVDVVWTEAA